MFGSSALFARSASGWTLATLPIVGDAASGVGLFSASGVGLLSASAAVPIKPRKARS